MSGLTEDDIRRIVREELQRAARPDYWPTQPFPMPVYHYQTMWPGGPPITTCTASTPEHDR